MKAKKISSKKESQAVPFPFPFGDFQNMAEKMKTFCQGEGDTFDCCSFMRKMTGQGKGAEVKETEETEKQPKDGKKG